MAAIVYGLKNCDTCRKALKALRDATLTDVRAESLPEAVLAQAHKQFGDALLNTRSTTWRGLSEEERSGDPITLIRQHPALMKRPLISVGETLFLSWNKEIEAQVKASR